MASVSAFVLMGPSHPNDTGLSPEWICELWEGDRPKWVLRSLRPNRRNRTFSPRAPGRILDSLQAAIGSAYPESLNDIDEPIGVSLVVVCLDGSSLAKSLPRLRKLERFDVHEAPVSWYRNFDRWSGKWKTPR